MKVSEFYYDLPPDLIAQKPIEPRDHSRLLVLDKTTGEIQDQHFFDIFDILGENDVLVLNRTKVINARLKGLIEGGMQVEVFLHKQLSGKSWDCLVYPGKKLKPGVSVSFSDAKGDIVLEAIICDYSDNGRVVEFSQGGDSLLAILEQIGETPLPPYIKDTSSKPERYQTVYSEEKGSVAAPTAGLHFTPELLESLEKKGVKIEKVLLHVGLGTFKGVETENIGDHIMHTESCEIDEDTAKRLNQYKQQGRNIIAVGTTSVRTLESFCDASGMLQWGRKETNIFIYPGYTWKFVTSIITNFHLPASTLLMLVSSFAGQESIKKAYQHAIDQKYRFFSFGDAMFIR